MANRKQIPCTRPWTVVACGWPTASGPPGMFARGPGPGHAGHSPGRRASAAARIDGRWQLPGGPVQRLMRRIMAAVAAGLPAWPAADEGGPYRCRRSMEFAMHATILALAAFALVLAPLPVLAQGAPAHPAEPTEAHGAIAFGQTAYGESVAYGFAWNYGAKDEAVGAALGACRAGGGTDCEALAWFRNGCGALAADQFGYAAGANGMSPEPAEARAVRGCEAAGGSGCAVVGSQCASPGGQAGTWSGSERVLAHADTDTAEPEAERGMPAAGAAQGTPATDAREEEALPREVRVLVQKGLASLGFDPGPADGLFGRRTRAAIWDWQAAKEHEATGYLTVPEAEALAAVGMEAGEAPDMAMEESAGQPVSAQAASEPGEWQGTAPKPQVLYFPSCGTDDARPDGCWFPLSEPAGCVRWSFGRWDSPPDPYQTWTGECDDTNRASGRGTLTDENGDTATGELVAGMRQGQWAEQRSFEDSDGNIVEDEAEGPYVDGKRHGLWTLQGTDGDMEKGPYVEGRRHGDWVIKFRWKDDDGNIEGADTYGPYVDGKMHGEWVERYLSGWTHRGAYVEGEPHGRWVETERDGSIRYWEYRYGELLAIESEP